MVGEARQSFTSRPTHRLVVVVHYSLQFFLPRPWSLAEDGECGNDRHVGQ